MVRSLEEKRDISLLQNAQTGSGLHSSPDLSDAGDFCGGKTTRAWINHSPPSNVKFKNESSYTSTSHIPPWSAQGRLYTFLEMRTSSDPWTTGSKTLIYTVPFRRRNQLIDRLCSCIDAVSAKCIHRLHESNETWREVEWQVTGLWARSPKRSRIEESLPIFRETSIFSFYLHTACLTTRSSDIVVSTVFSLWAGRSGVRFQAEAGDFCLLQNIPNRLWSSPTFQLHAYRGLFLRW